MWDQAQAGLTGGTAQGEREQGVVSGLIWGHHSCISLQVWGEGRVGVGELESRVGWWGSGRNGITVGYSLCGSAYVCSDQARGKLSEGWPGF